MPAQTTGPAYVEPGQWPCHCSEQRVVKWAFRLDNMMSTAAVPAVRGGSLRHSVKDVSTGRGLRSSQIRSSKTSSAKVPVRGEPAPGHPHHPVLSPSTARVLGTKTTF